MPIRGGHHARNGFGVVVRNSRLKQIAQRVYKNQLGRPPGKRLSELLRHQPQIKPLLIRMPLNPAKPLRKRLGIAVLAAGADLDTAANGVPRGVGPFDVRVERHPGTASEGSRASDPFESRSPNLESFDQRGFEPSVKPNFSLSRILAVVDLEESVRNRDQVRQFAFTFINFFTTKETNRTS